MKYKLSHQIAPGKLVLRRVKTSTRIVLITHELGVIANYERLRTDNNQRHKYSMGIEIENEGKEKTRSMMKQGKK